MKRLLAQNRKPVMVLVVECDVVESLAQRRMLAQGVGDVVRQVRVTLRYLSGETAAAWELPDTTGFLYVVERTECEFRDRDRKIKLVLSDGRLVWDCVDGEMSLKDCV